MGRCSRAQGAGAGEGEGAQGDWWKPRQVTHTRTHTHQMKDISNTQKEALSNDALRGPRVGSKCRVCVVDGSASISRRWGSAPKNNTHTQAQQNCRSAHVVKIVEKVPTAMTTTTTTTATRTTTTTESACWNYYMAHKIFVQVYKCRVIYFLLQLKRISSNSKWNCFGSDSQHTLFV